MKIKKPLMESKLVEEESTAPVDAKAASTGQLADKIQQSSEENPTKENPELTDKQAQAVAQEVKFTAQQLDRALWAPLNLKNDLTDALDSCLEVSLQNKSGLFYSSDDDEEYEDDTGSDLLVNGLPGSAKTAIVRSWARQRGVNLHYINAKQDNLGAILDGFPVHVIQDLEAAADKGSADSIDPEVAKEIADRLQNHAAPVKKQKHSVIQAYSSVLDPLDRERSVLFLDEFNRAPKALRAVLLTLINEHNVAGDGPDGYRHFPNLLFTVACINPSVPTDPGAGTLNDAELSRFANKMTWDSDVDTASKFLQASLKERQGDLNRNKLSDDAYAFMYRKLEKQKRLAAALLNSVNPPFQFDSRSDLLDLYNAGDPYTMLNQRAITDGIRNHGHNKAEFLEWAAKRSGFLPRDITMIQNILNNYKEPADESIKVPGVEEVAKAKETPNTAADKGDGSFEGTFGKGAEDGSDETDKAMFGAGGNNAQNNLNNIKNKLKNKKI